MEKKEIAEKLKKIALEAQFASERVKAMEALGEMGENGAEPLSEIGSKARWSAEREKALELVKKALKEKKEG